MTAPRKTLRPPPLKPGDRIGIVAAGGPVRAEAFDRGIAYLEGRGFVPVLGRHVRQRRAYLAGSDGERLQDLNEMIADRSIRAIWFARGGYGASRIVSAVDLRPLRRDPKALIGYSDVTVIQAAAWRRLGLVTHHGPMVSELGSPGTFDEAALWMAVAGDRGRDLTFALPAASVLRPGRAAGPIVGGCLAVVMSLLGTPFELPTDGAIFFWEEVNEPPYRIDRMLSQLRLAGRLQGLKGMVVGRLVGCGAGEPENDLPLAEILRAHLEGTDYPVVLDFPAGHCAGKVTLPLGGPARLVARPGAGATLRVSGR